MCASRLTSRRTQLTTSSAQQMLPDNRTLSKDAKETAKDRRGRKRAQNRISQQCVREKQVVYSKQIEALAGLIKSSTKMDDDETAASKTAHLNMQMALIEENRELRDALLRMRKKMLSLSSAVGAVADDPIFGHVLSKERSQQNSALQKSATGDCDEEEGKNRQQIKPFAEKAPVEELESVRVAGRLNRDRQQPPLMVDELAEGPSEPSHTTVDMKITSRDNNSYDSIRPATGTLTERQGSPSAESSSVPFTSHQIDLDGMTLTETNAHESPMSASSASSAESLPPASYSDKRAVGIFQSHKDGGQDESMQEQFGVLLNDLSYIDSAGFAEWSGFPSTDVQYLSSLEFVPEGPGYETLKFHVVGDNCWKIEEACLRYLARHFNIRGLEPSIHDLRSKEVSHYDALRTAISGLDFGDSVVADVTKVAVDIMCKTSGFSQYIYGIGANRAIEKVFQWRLSPSTRNRLLIPEPFQPTPLQYMRNCNYPAAIDFLNWPSIRDQLIFKAGTYDLDQVVADIVANTVIEIPEKRVAINIHDTFFTKIFSMIVPAANSASTLGSGNISLEQGDSEAWESGAAGQASVGWSSADVFYYIKHQIDALSKSRMASTNLLIFNNCLPSLLNSRPSLRMKQPLASKWGLDKLYQWKLSKEFAQAYPFLDCTGGEPELDLRRHFAPEEAMLTLNVCKVTASFPMFASRTVPDL